MGTPLFNSTTLPVLEQVVNFAQNRHRVLAGNIANLDTPGYRVRDLSPEKFQQNLKQAIRIRDEDYDSLSDLAESGSNVASFDDVKESMKSILFHDDSNVSLEHQVAELGKNQAMHNMALTIMRSQFHLLEMAISERVVRG